MCFAIYKPLYHTLINTLQDVDISDVAKYVFRYAKYWQVFRTGNEKI